MISMEDIAARAGVSRSTVSLVLNRRQASARISDATSRRVLTAAADLGYQPNEMARAIATGKNHVLGFLSFHPDVEFVAAMMSGVLEEADAHGYIVKVMRLADDATNRRVIQRCVESRLAGVVSVYLPEDLQTKLTRYDIPIAHLDSSSETPSGIHVVSDDQRGSYEAVEHLVSLGHRRIAFIGGEIDMTTSHRRELGYRQGMQGFGLDVPESYVRHGDWQVPETMAAAHEMLTDSRVKPPTAILCASDFIALAVMRVARSLGLHVPNDLSVIGFADMEFARYVPPPLTSVAQPFPEMGRTAIRELLPLLTDPQTPAPLADRVLPTKLMVRDSTAPAKNAP